MIYRVLPGILLGDGPAETRARRKHGSKATTACRDAPMIAVGLPTLVWDGKTREVESLKRIMDERAWQRSTGDSRPGREAFDD